METMADIRMMKRNRVGGASLHKAEATLLFKTVVRRLCAPVARRRSSDGELVSSVHPRHHRSKAAFLVWTIKAVSEPSNDVSCLCQVPRRPRRYSSGLGCKS